MKNNLGLETRIRYAPSTRFYLADRAAGRPWVTRLPFPVQVVERVETYDHVSRVRLVSEYRYHHGPYDGHEREFCGFGMVEQVDTEAFSAHLGQALFPEVTVRNGRAERDDDCARDGARSGDVVTVAGVTGIVYSIGLFVTSSDTPWRRRYPLGDLHAVLGPERCVAPGHL
ncbi:toxin TcdB middle/N-terminal domain-containing protein [Sorangium sp. So ce269]